MEVEHLDRLIDYWARRQRYSPFTPTETLRKELSLPKNETSKALRLFSELGLGSRQYKTKKHRAGFRWKEPEVRALMRKN